MNLLATMLVLVVGLVGLVLFLCILPYLLVFWAICIGGMVFFAILGWLLRL